MCKPKNLGARSLGSAGRDRRAIVREKAIAVTWCWVIATGDTYNRDVYA
jgi:hypothetical protein